MKTEKFPHEQFLKDNNIDYKTLPEMLYKRIKGFEELKEDLDQDNITDEDRDKLTEQLEMLSHELSEDLEEEFEDHLENNDQEEEEEEKTEPEPTVVEEEPAIEPEPVLQEEIAPEPSIEPSDEEILKDFITNQKALVSQAELKAKGFKTPLNGKVVYVGKLCLHKGKYDTCYKIIVNG